MTHIPSRVSNSPLRETLEQGGLSFYRRGKVRDTFEIPGHPDMLLVVATDRISVFDLVLPVLVPDKGQVLTAMTVMWLTSVLSDVTHHLLAFGSEIDGFLPQSLRGMPELHRRAIVVKKLEMLPIEAICRGYLTGSAWSEYRRKLSEGSFVNLWGTVLPQGLGDGSKLDTPIFTPTTKAETGHDQPISLGKFYEQFPGIGIDMEIQALLIYQQACGYALERGVIIADTKFEFGFGSSNVFCLADEALTPDSSRFWLEADWSAAQRIRRSPAGYDKQPVSDHLLELLTPFANEEGAHLRFGSLDPENETHLSWVDALAFPPEIVASWARRYQACFLLLAGDHLSNFQRKYMKIF